MVITYFLYGLSFFCLGMVVGMESTRPSQLSLGKQLKWLAGFGLLHSLVEWSEMGLLLQPTPTLRVTLQSAQMLLMPLSALLLVRFGVGLLHDAGPFRLPAWLDYAPAALLVPVSLMATYILIVAITELPLATAVDIWCRYLLYLPGCLLSAMGFIRQWQEVAKEKMIRARQSLLGAALAFLLDGLLSGLIAPAVSFGPARWLNYDAVLQWTGIPIQIWRAFLAAAIAFLVIRTLRLFEDERQQVLDGLNRQREQAQRLALQAQFEARRAAEGWTDALVGISRRIANLETVDEALNAIVEAALFLLRADAAALALWDETTSNLEINYFAFPDKSEHIQDNLAAGQTHSLNISSAATILECVKACCPTRFPDDTPPDVHWFCPLLAKEIHAAVIVPLQLEGQSLGGLWVSRLASDTFSLADQAGLQRLADQAVIAIEHERLTARLQSLAVVEERSRLAREMHDGLSQILGYLSLETQALEALVHLGDRQALLAEIKQVSANVQHAQEDVRENILSLRTTLAGAGGAIPALEEYLQEFGFQTGVEARLVCYLTKEPKLSPLSETQMVRIIQEALTNVRKHARAKQVEVWLADHADCLQATVTDDGIGFDMPAKQGRFGLLTMRERAESVGGGLTITSHPGEGTQVSLWIPTVKQTRQTPKIQLKGERDVPIETHYR